MINLKTSLKDDALGENFSETQSPSSSLPADSDSSVFSGKQSLAQTGSPAVGNMKAFPQLSFCITLDFSSREGSR